MDGQQTLVSIAIIAGVVAIFASIGYVCCYFKNKCRPLYEHDDQDAENVHLRRRKNSGVSGVSEESSDSSSSFRKTLFQISYGEGTSEKPSRAKRKSPLANLSFIRKSKTFSNTLKSLRRKNTVSHPPVHEAIEEVNPNPNCIEIE